MNKISKAFFIAILTAMCAFPAVAALSKTNYCTEKGLTSNTECWFGHNDEDKNGVKLINYGICNTQSNGCKLISCDTDCICAAPNELGLITCPTCSCTSGTIWTDVDGQNYQINTSWCESRTACNPTTAYRCKQGFYYDSADATNSDGGQIVRSAPDCKPCPSSGGIAGTTDQAGIPAITRCLIPSGTSFSDISGNGTYTNDCYWTE